MKRIEKIIANGGNVLLVIIGRTRSGKSWSGLALGEQFSEMLGLNFSVWNVCFTPISFLEKLNSGMLKRGSVLVFDEVGVAAPSKEWYSATNKCLSTVTQTFGHMGLFVIFTVPDWSYVDSDMRKLFHSYVEMDFPPRLDNLRRGRWYDITFDGREKKYYYKYPTFTDEDGTKWKLRFLLFNKPTDKLAADYEALSEPYKNKLMGDALNKVAGLDAKLSGGDEQSIVNLVLARQERYAYYSKSGKLHFRMGLIEADFKVGNRISARVRELAKQKISLPHLSIYHKKKQQKTTRRHKKTASTIIEKTLEANTQDTPTPTTITIDDKPPKAPGETTT